MGVATLQLPHALRRRECGSIQYLAERNARCPVLLVHGYAANLLISGCGHLTICRDVRLIRSLVRELIRTETLAHADAGAPAGANREPMAA